MPYNDFVVLWNSEAARNTYHVDTDPLLSGGFSLAMAEANASPFTIDYGDAGAALTVLATVTAAACVAYGINALLTHDVFDFAAAERAVSDLIPWDQTGQAFAYRLPGIDAKVGTLAGHLAKLLEVDVAGYPPSSPNPHGDPNRKWCITIRNKIEEIRGARYSERQLLRDLERAGFGGRRWTEITNAIAEVVARGLCDDHWGDFDGGAPLATG